MRNRFLRGLIPALTLAALPALSSAGVFVGVSVNLAPPPLPVYVQPPCPEPGYLWVPGYWAWDDGAYYWVPGTWVLPPQVGLLWTPGYWGWDDDDDAYDWHAGYWGPHVGFYGGIDYGFGYDGEGFDGGYWRGGMFLYNRAVVHVGPTFVTNVYYHPVVYRTAHEHVSFNGGRGGVEARPSREQMFAEHERHVGFTPVQQRQQRMAFADRALRADYNHGRPPIAATARPAVFHGSGVLPARAAGGPVHFDGAHGPSREAAPMRSDRPSWATGQTRGAHTMERATPGHGQPGFSRPEQQRFESRPQQRFESPPQRQRFESRPQQRFEAPSQQQRFESRPQQRFEAPPQQQRFESRPQQRFEAPPQQQRFESRPQPEFRQNFSPQGHGGPGYAPAPRPQERGGDRRPPDNRGGHR